ncbi:MAG: TauD/TfdA family dioxygenase [Rhodospirillaceae bacterium]|jgi:hypothetical protein|nr:TauD/TfdA family dioxygenase [Rhodospirillaceae bacterium]MBT6304748.1 TauD/TfdA family dioxygenase [Rhodospirillaceae bacterium]MBT7732498.1 TauD/TfdA family dioxygenase [Rhodospirillaceae bacterium]
MNDFKSPAAWETSYLNHNNDWVFMISDAEKNQLSTLIKNVYEKDRNLFDYSPSEFDFGSSWNTIAKALSEALHGRGLAIVKGLPREDLSHEEFRLLSWAIGLKAGVARPQGMASQYIAAVRDIGTNYRAANGRGYSSSAKLDFHVDGADLTTLTCYNKAKSGGQSMISSGVTARNYLVKERPDLAEVASQYFYFSRQSEQASDETPFYGQPLFDEENGHLFCKWNRNRVQSAQNLEGVPKLSDAQKETMEVLDEILRRPELMYTMYLEPGDMQILNNYTMFHSRTDYIDFENESDKRCLYRLWLAPPDSIKMPESWRDFYRSIEPETVRGGIRGQSFDKECENFDKKHAKYLNMKIDSRPYKIQTAK